MLEQDPGEHMPEDGPFTLWLDQSAAEFEVLTVASRDGVNLTLEDPTTKPHRRRAPAVHKPAAIDYEEFAAGGGGGYDPLEQVEAYDSFADKALGALTDADSDQPYHSTGSAPLTVQVSGSRKVLTHSLVSGSGAGYEELELPGPCRWAFAKVRFQNGTTAGSVIAIAASNQSLASGHTPEMAPHTVFGPAGDWQATVWEGTPDATVDYTGDSGDLFGVSDRGLAPHDGETECWCGFSIDDQGHCRLLLPNGDIRRTRDARYLTVPGNYVFFEIDVTNAATDAKPEFLDWMAGTTSEEMARFFDQRGFTYEVVRQMLRQYPSTGEVAAYTASSIVVHDTDPAAHSDRFDEKLSIDGSIAMTGLLQAPAGVDLVGQPLSDSALGYPWATGGLYTDGDLYADGGVVVAGEITGSRLALPVAFKNVPLTGSKTLLLTTADPGFIALGTTPATGGKVKLPTLNSGDVYQLTLANRSANDVTLTCDGSNAMGALSGGIGDILVPAHTWIAVGYYGATYTFYQMGA